MKSLLSVLVGCLFGLAGCRSTHEGYTPIILGVSSVDAPTSISKTASLPVTLHVPVGGCLVFDHLEVTRDQVGASMIAWGHDITEGVKDRGILCTRIVDEAHRYTFDPPFGGTFTISVERGRISPLITSVTVN